MFYQYAPDRWRATENLLEIGALRGSNSDFCCCLISELLITRLTMLIKKGLTFSQRAERAICQIDKLDN